ncbi:hypothetical protein ACEWY4_003575 [Coilia grayii]|uniref:T-box domain-containing protein n=1 Tax=Coilia grayii TaxID=363190 RepID=A0ABD1KRM4_9TELE
MLGVEMYPSLPLGHQRLGDCYYRDRDVAPPHVPLYPSSCDASARSLPPRLLAPPPAPATHEAPPKPQDNIKMELENASLWKQFSTIGTEMIITKKGRRMFPQLRVKVSGLNPSLRYILLLDIVPADSSRYRFQDDSWQVVGGAEARLPDRVFIHPDSPATGEHWQNRTISFHRTKLTNNTLDSQGYIILHSLHRYQPRLHVIEARDMLLWGGARHSFTFPETQFLTVTAYQNNKITELKINSNPFAKGFRENGMNSKRQREARSKRKINTQDTEGLDDLDIESCDPCDPCDSTEVLPQNPTLSITSSSLSMTDPSCGFHGNAPSFPGSTVTDQPISLGQAFISSQMTEIPDITEMPASIDSGLPTTTQDDLNDSLIDRSGQMIDLQSFSAPFADSSQFDGVAQPQSSSSYSSVTSSISSARRPDPLPLPLSLPLPSSQSSPTSSSDHSSLPNSCYSSMLPSSTSSPPLQLPGSAYPSLSPSSSSEQLLLPSSSSTSPPAYPSNHLANHNPDVLSPHNHPANHNADVLSPHNHPANHNADVLSPHTPNTFSSSPSSSLPPHPPLQSLHPSVSVHPITPAQGQVSQMVPTHSTPPADQHTAAMTAFPFPPLQPQPNPELDPSTPHPLQTAAPHPLQTTAPLSAFPFPNHQPPTPAPAPTPTSANPITPQSIPNPLATAFPFPPASDPNPNAPSSDPNPSNGNLSSAFQFPASGPAGSNLTAAPAPAIPDPNHPTSFLPSVSSVPSSVSMTIHQAAPPVSFPLPCAPSAVQSYSIPHPNPTQTHNPIPSHPFSSLPPSIPSCPPLHPSLPNPGPGIPNPAQIQPGYPTAFPASSFPHIPAASSNPTQIASCSMIPSQTFQPLPLPSSAPAHHPSPSLPPAAYPQYQAGAATAASYPAVPSADGATYPGAQFNPGAPYLPEMVLHSSLLPSIDPSLSSSAPPALYPSFSSYPLRLCQDPRSSFHIPLRHIYRQPQHAHPHSQGSYLDMSGRAVF